MSEHIQNLIIEYSMPDFFDSLDKPSKDAIRESLVEDDEFKKLVGAIEEYGDSRELEGRLNEAEDNRDLWLGSDNEHHYFGLLIERLKELESQKEKTE